MNPATSDTPERYFNKLQRHNGLLINTRFFYIILLSGVAAATSTLAGQSSSSAFHYLLIGGTGVAINLVLWVLNRHLPQKIVWAQIVMVVQIMLDLGLASYVIYDQGGLQSRATALFALPIISAGLLFSTFMVYSTALLAGFGYVAAIFYYANHQEMLFNWPDFVMPGVFYPVIFLILARLVSYLKSVAEQR